MLVDDLQKLTDLFVTEANSTLTPKPLWRPFIELLFEDIDTLDLNEKDKILVADLEYLKEIALALALTEEEELGKLLSPICKSSGIRRLGYLVTLFSYVYFRELHLVGGRGHSRASLVRQFKENLVGLHQRGDQRRDRRIEISPLHVSGQRIDGSD